MGTSSFIRDAAKRRHVDLSPGKYENYPPSKRPHITSAVHLPMNNHHNKQASPRTRTQSISWTMRDRRGSTQTGPNITPILSGPSSSVPRHEFQLLQQQGLNIGVPNSDPTVHWTQESIRPQNQYIGQSLQSYASSGGAHPGSHFQETLPSNAEVQEEQWSATSNILGPQYHSSQLSIIPPGDLSQHPSKTHPQASDIQYPSNFDSLRIKTLNLEGRALINAHVATTGITSTIFRDSLKLMLSRSELQSRVKPWPEGRLIWTAAGLLNNNPCYIDFSVKTEAMLRNREEPTIRLRFAVVDCEHHPDIHAVLGPSYERMLAAARSQNMGMEHSNQNQRVPGDFPQGLMGRSDTEHSTFSLGYDSTCNQSYPESQGLNSSTIHSDALLTYEYENPPNPDYSVPAYTAPTSQEANNSSLGNMFFDLDMDPSGTQPDDPTY
ncbi:hypothetical protein F5Y19DRAFT_438065 [Xylariaceae sp. FL1651]|nr:hypothetical protein F5Y19DRAFT_438065 [Xylariaceae sp. FL1651]